LLLASAVQASSLMFFLTEGDSTILNPGEVFNLRTTAKYVFLALGDVMDSVGPTRPTLMQMDTLVDPSPDWVRFRFSHALTGSTGPIDVYVNGVVIANLSYGRASAPVDFPARAAGGDSLIVVPAGDPPDGPTVIWKNLGGDLFDADRTYDAFLAHKPQGGIHGDIFGAAEVLLPDLP